MTTKNNDRQKILIVDDEPDITIALKMYLEIQGFHVDTCTNPANALTHFKVGFYDLLILDIKIKQSKYSF
jgi:DNA-binding response OmpR family regulator